MQRSATFYLKDWFNDSSRKPLVIRGARQTGKTWLVRNFAVEQGLVLIELNFESNPRLSVCFESNNPKEILLKISVVLSIESIDPKKCLLFLDEIQAFPEMIAKLRWFAENMPELPVIAAGSLYQFAFEWSTFKVPVGRIDYMYLEPFSFEEFMLASHRKELVDYLKSHRLNNTLPLRIHEDFMRLFKEYIIVGGMPAAVAEWIQKHSFQPVRHVHEFIVAAYREDFNRYKTRIDVALLDQIMMLIPNRLGQKFIYSKVDPALQTVSIKRALDLLVKAGICSKIRGTAANDVTSGHEIGRNNVKVIFVDIGLSSSELGLPLNQIINTPEVDLINSGGIAEQAVGQLLRTIFPFYHEPDLYYWQSEKGGNAEIDYVVNHRNKIIPIEVNPGSPGSLKSLHLFMELKKLPLAVRINSSSPQVTQVQVRGMKRQSVDYTLVSLPFYLIGELHRLLKEYAVNAEKSTVAHPAKAHLDSFF